MSFVLCVLGTVIFLLEGSIKRSTAHLQIPGRRKKRVQRDKNENANNVVFYAILAHPSHMQFLLSQNTKVTNTQFKIPYKEQEVTYRLPYKIDYSERSIVESIVSYEESLCFFLLVCDCCFIYCIYFLISIYSCEALYHQLLMLKAVLACQRKKPMSHIGSVSFCLFYFYYFLIPV